MPTAAQHSELVQSPFVAAQVDHTQGATSGMRGPRALQVHGVESKSQRSTPGMQSTLHVPKPPSTFSKHCMPESLQHWDELQSSPPELAHSGGEPAVRSPSCSQLHLPASRLRGSGPGMQAVLHSAQLTSFAKHCMPGSLQHLESKQLVPDAEQGSSSAPCRLEARRLGCCDGRLPDWATAVPRARRLTPNSVALPMMRKHLPCFAEAHATSTASCNGCSDRSDSSSC
mmetsp:Transcript_66483/g.191097  ORF Transcript_66483/g.191097 Transcript_66483/m.191097 type:complete len:228 (+) Transcript_66483:1143-1826(+)